MHRDQIETLFYGRPEHQRRFTQDFPILPDVWIEYGRTPAARVELLLTPHNESDASTVARALRERLQRDPTSAAKPRVLYNESVVLASLTFPQLLRGALPLTAWWQRSVAPMRATWTQDALRTFSRQLNEFTPGQRVIQGTDPKLLQKLIRIVGHIEMERRGLPVPEQVDAAAPLTGAEIDAFAAAFDGLADSDDGTAGVLWGISLNRRASTSIWRSRLTVKADAAARLFEAKTSGIRWAVLDTGIDATHPAFTRRSADGSVKAGRAAKPPAAGQHDELNSRVVRSFNFLRIKELLDPDAELTVEGTAAAALPQEELDEQREQLRERLRRGRAVDWDLLEPFLRIPHTKRGYQAPQHDSHGTHVAGILAANWPEAEKTMPMAEPLVGVCPDLELYDLRVLPDDPNDSADEFTVIAALQFVRHLNAHKDLMVIHGVNLSLSVPHDVANYACGRTPVCEECERVVAAGVVVVTAAGNRGFNKSAEAQGGAVGDYRYISITDPGNADGVITVGSTHRMMPHNYGVSYFSSRGPTGDGRTKPDLVAPGERIESCSLNGYVETMDGTSMAAPHVSGAAALLMSRHRELIGQPRRIKEILCTTATDLGRERRFQGAGMVDVLRAIQAV
jgi:subtilisin family serine protease